MSHVVPRADCLNGNGVEQVSVAQIGTYLSSLFCAALSAAAPHVTTVLVIWDSHCFIISLLCKYLLHHTVVAIYNNIAMYSTANTLI